MIIEAHEEVPKTASPQIVTWGRLQNQVSPVKSC